MPPQPMTYQQLVANVVALMQSNHYEGATHLLRTAIRQNPQAPHLQYLLALCHEASQHMALALKHIRQALASAAHVPDYHKAHARFLLFLERLDEAEAAYARALELNPDDDDTLGQLAELHALRQQFDRAREVMAPWLAQERPPLGIVLAHAKMADRLGEEARAIEMLQRVVEDGAVHPQVRSNMGMQLGRLLDKQGDYERAFAEVDRANALVRRPYDRAAADAETNAIVQAWSAEAYRALPSTGFTSTRPVFIIGIPRSGSTLTEQILSSHSKVAGAGEWPALGQAVMALQTKMKMAPAGPERWEALSRLKAEDVKEAARAFLARTREVDREATHVTDKMLANFRHLGYISLMFPKAPVIVCWRDPYDAVLSIYFQNFVQGIPYANDMAAAAHHHVTFRRLVRHWESITPNPVCHVQYEEIVEDLEGQARRLVSFVGLPWEEACLNFHRNARVTVTASAQQVRRPIYRTSVKRHKHYAAHLAPIREVLEAYGEA